ADVGLMPDECAMFVKARRQLSQGGRVDAKPKTVRHNSSFRRAISAKHRNDALQKYRATSAAFPHGRPGSAPRPPRERQAAGTRGERAKDTDGRPAGIAVEEPDKQHADDLSGAEPTAADLMWAYRAAVGRTDAELEDVRASLQRRKSSSFAELPWESKLKLRRADAKAGFEGKELSDSERVTWSGDASQEFHAMRRQMHAVASPGHMKRFIHHVEDHHYRDHPHHPHHKYPGAFGLAKHRPHYKGAGASLVRAEGVFPGDRQRLKSAVKKKKKNVTMPGKVGEKHSTHQSEKSRQLEHGWDATGLDKDDGRGRQAEANGTRRDPRGNGPLHWAAAAGDLRKLTALLSKSRASAACAANDAGETPLHKAIAAGAAFGTSSEWLDAARLLLSAGADPMAADASGETPMLRAISVEVGGYANRVLELVEMLLEAGARGTEADHAGENGLHRAVMFIRHAARCRRVIDCLKRVGVSPGASPSWTQTDTADLICYQK
ncbi:hypothetical protein CYMTET_16076, partial [Cymbomonas tetramitiformis]